MLQGVIRQLKEGASWQSCLEQAIAAQSALLERQRQAGQPDHSTWNRCQKILQTLEDYRTALAQAAVTNSSAAADLLRSQFQVQVQARKEAILATSNQLDCAFRFLEQVFGEGQELVIFLTELTVNHHSMKFIGENGCEPYHRYNQLLLLGGRQARF